ncbi:MAG TPA: hypothetical protein VK427_16095 [Kofleriaceae bacterium]|nr:hypothetical protein [Kofleriaceae bacterium]
MKHSAIVFALGAALLGACGSKKPEPAAPPAGSAAPAPAITGVTLELAELKIIDVAKNQAVLVHADGEIEYQGMKGVRVTKDGRIMKSDTGEVGFTLLPDGAIQGPDGKVIDVTLTPDGVIKIGDKAVSIGDNGAIVGGQPGAPEMKIEGATTPGLKRTAMFVLIALTTPEETPPPPAPAPPAPKK